MTTPGSYNDTDIGSLEIFGIPFSTFTRSITLGLEELGLGSKYIQHHTPPHSDEVKARNPFGLLPVLVHRPSSIYTAKENVVVLFESNAVRRYLDEYIAPSANTAGSKNASVQLTPASRQQDDPSSALLRAKVDQWVSLASSVLFPAVEFGVVKPRMAMEKNEADEASIQTALSEGVAKAYQKIDILEKMIEEGREFLCGSQITWADLFVYPPLADLRAIKEGEVLHSSDSRYPKLTAWLDRMDSRPSAKSTFEGTLASQRK